MKLYFIINKLNSKVYIGKTERSINKRWTEHKKCSKSGSKYHLHSSMRMHGINNFVICEIPTIVNSIDELNKYEKSLIEFFGTNNPKYGYNLTEGGEGTTGHTVSEEVKYRLRIFNLGKQSPNKVKLLTQEQRLLCGVQNIGRKPSEYNKQRTRETFLGKHLGDEHRGKISDSNKGNKPSLLAIQNSVAYRKGKKLSDSHKEKLRLAWERRKQCTN
jgi:group I intron endonuclease